MNPWLILGVVVAFVLNGLYWNAHGSNAADTRWAAKINKERAEASEAARAKEQMWQGVVNGTVKNYETRVSGIRADRDAALVRLQSRPGRADSLSIAPRPAGSCATGASLCREDGQFLRREAARADELREALVACYEVIDATK